MAVAVKGLLCEAMRNFVAGSHGNLLLDIREPESFGPHKLLVGHYADRNSRQVAIRDLSANPSREHALGGFNLRIVRYRRRTNNWKCNQENAKGPPYHAAMLSHVRGAGFIPRGASDPRRSGPHARGLRATL